MAAPTSELRPRECPKSATSFALNSLAALSLVVTLYVLHGRHFENNQNRVLIVLGATALPIGVLDLLVLKVHRRASTGLDWDKPFELDFGRTVTKLIGLAVTLGAIAFAWWIFNEYHGSFYDPWYALFRRFWAPLATLSVAYIAFVDAIMRDPKDAYWQLGRLVLGHREDVNRQDLAKHARGWLVKAFFLPLMMVYLHNDVRDICDRNMDGATWANGRVYDFLYTGIFLGDLTFTVIGYVMAFRVTDSHFRSAEPTMLGWAVALFCYMPFYSMMSRNYVEYEAVPFSGWGWMREHPHLMGAWQFTILCLVGIYVLATVAFGWRFSNLTHRGILTGGPYRFTKHPAYVSKNLSWWLISVPWVVPQAGQWDLAIRHCVALLCINTIYFLRARTEERHLSQDPTYVEYALWMNDNGVFSWLGKAVPFFRYKPPAGAPLPAVPATAEREAA
jgi:protein-S-isoprenylcysteine O-methyltransferase Ste14